MEPNPLLDFLKSRLFQQNRPKADICAEKQFSFAVPMMLKRRFFGDGQIMVGEVGFCDWRPWSERTELEGKNLPGVYFIARSKKKPDNYRVNNDFIIYIGETTGQTLADRLRQFNTSAFSERPGHSGGNTFRLTLLETTPLEHLWISACPVDMGQPYTTAYIKHLERKLLWEYVCTWGRYPDCNRS